MVPVDINFLYFVHQVNYISHCGTLSTNIVKYVQNICVCAAVDVSHNSVLLCLSLRAHLPTSTADWYL